MFNDTPIKEKRSLLNHEDMADNTGLTMACTTEQKRCNNFQLVDQSPMKHFSFDDDSLDFAPRSPPTPRKDRILLKAEMFARAPEKSLDNAPIYDNVNLDDLKWDMTGELFDLSTQGGYNSPDR